MPQPDWFRIQNLFLEAAAMSHQDRVAFLERECLDEPDVRAEVETLLVADTDDDSSLRAAIEEEVRMLFDESSLASTRLGPYRLLKEIGWGGMGSVYLAERDDDQFRKRVAVKFVRRGMDSAEVLGRFRHERQILADLEHSYIARLIDGGTTPDGVPFFVMEYVEGQRIDLYQRDNHLDLTSTLLLFIRVCEAVSYAHRSLVIHRDLKPGNILVTAEGVPKLLDFGVAKLLGSNPSSGTTLTSYPIGPLTPEYASPEQVRGLSLTTATDVYSLGAILYELLTGQRACHIETQTPAEIERAICEREVPRPSGVAHASFGHRIDADLDNIVMMAMHKDRERRYPSVEQLADDLTRYLEGRPVRARQDSLGYRTRMFIRRHRLSIAAAALVVMSLIVGATVAITQARRAEAARQVAEAQRRTAERERTRAESEAQKAEAQRALAKSQMQQAQLQRQLAERRLSDMIALSNRSLFDVHSAIEKLPGATQTRKQIVEATLKFLEDLSKSAGDDDRLRFVLSVSYAKVADVQGDPTRANLGDSAGALANYQRSDRFIEPLLAKEPGRPEYILQWLEVKKSIAVLMNTTGDTRRAAEILQSLLPNARRVSGLCPKDIHCLMAEGSVDNGLVETLSGLDSHAALKFAQQQSRNYERALFAFPENVEVQRELATAYSQEAKMWNAQGELAKAAERYHAAIKQREKLLQRNPSDGLVRRNLMVTYGNLGGNLGGTFYPNLGDVAGAREYYGKALAIARDMATVDPKDQLAQYDLAFALLLYASLALPREEWPQSLQMLRESESILQRITATDPQSIAKQRPLAMVEEYEGHRLEGMGQKEEAIACYRKSIMVTERVLNKHPAEVPFITEYIAGYEALAEALASTGDRQGALQAAETAIEQAQHSRAQESERERLAHHIPDAYLTLAIVQSRFEDWSKCHDAADRAVASYRQLLASGNPFVKREKAARAEELLETSSLHLH